MGDQPDWKVWRGPEVEGQYKGLNTLFVREMPQASLRHYFSLPGLEQVLFHWEFLKRYGTPWIDAAYEYVGLVTLYVSIDEVLEVNRDFKGHVLVYIPLPHAIPESLLNRSSIRVDIGPGRRFISFDPCAGCILHTHPNDYDHDERLE